MTLALLVLAACTMAGGWRYRGPAPKPRHASEAVPAAGRMRDTLRHLLGDPPATHALGTEAGEAFLRRLEATIESHGVATRRIEIPWDPQAQPWHPKGRVDLLPEQTVLKNLVATVPGREPDLAPIVLATHHDSCRFGPGAGDAGAGVVALVEHLRILSRQPPRRTTHYLFTDGEEFGLLGAHALAAYRRVPFDEPLFVLNFDARGTSGGVPMFETHRGNAAWVNALVNHLAEPKITSSMAVTVYRRLPNATDFDVWNRQLGWPGFNFAAIGGAHRYHTPEDRPENLDPRMLQHMGDHAALLHAALDRMPAEAVSRDASSGAGTAQPEAVFFDLYGYTVVHYRAWLQQGVAVAAWLALLGSLLRSARQASSCSRGRKRAIAKASGWAAALAVSAGLLGAAIGGVTVSVLSTTPWASQRYTPFDLGVGMLTVAVSVLAVSFGLEFWAKRIARPTLEMVGESTWTLWGSLAVLLAVALPGGAYLAVWPAVAVAVARWSGGSDRVWAWAGWLVAALLFGPVLVLLTQALGPWQQPLYGVLAAVLAVLAAPTWWQGSRRAASPDGGQTAVEGRAADGSSQ